MTPPTIAGTAKVGSTLTADHGTWTGSPTSYAYQWQRCKSSGTCQNVSGAVKSTYIPTGQDVGMRLDVVVTATNRVGSGTATSALTAVVVS